MPLGVLAQLPDIKEAAVGKLRARAAGHLEVVQRAVDDCREAARQLR